jgi:hypothetical protein
MSKIKDFDQVVHSSSNGKLYIRSEDFFQLPKVQKMVLELVNSDLYRSITKNKAEK